MPRGPTALVAAAMTVLVVGVGLRVRHASAPGRIDTAALGLAGRLADATAVRMLAVRVVGVVTPAAVAAATVALAVLAWALLRQWPVAVRVRVVGFCVGAPAASRGAEAALKYLVDRRPPRWGQLPASWLHDNPMLALSYPSGHVAITTTLALAGVLVLGAGRVRRGLLSLAVAAAAATVAVQGGSLVVLGFHFVTDVVGGAALGVAVTLGAALACGARPPRRAGSGRTAGTASPPAGAPAGLDAPPIESR